MKKNAYKVRKFETCELECIVLYSLIGIPEDIAFHPNFFRTIIVENANPGKTRIVNGKIKNVHHYCSIDIKEKIDASKIFKNNPFFMDYTVFQTWDDNINNHVYSTHLLFWIPNN
jgi:hypothetical protein